MEKNSNKKFGTQSLYLDGITTNEKKLHYIICQKCHRIIPNKTHLTKIGCKWCDTLIRRKKL